MSTSFRWTPHAKPHSITEGAEKFALTKKLRDLANERRRFGYRRLFVLLRRE
ncbi:hypothetical protein GOL97_32620, partial [Sinorhizobium medicae]|nr:hypothetical protein [Sinorhizobium medicae]